jgi:hypothetical protein
MIGTKNAIGIDCYAVGFRAKDWSFSEIFLERIPLTAKKVLIIEEQGFSRVCSALLELNGFQATCMQVPQQLPDLDRLSEFGLAVVSYPYGAPVLELLRQTDLPLLILSDSLNETLLNILKKARNYYFMSKPLDYEQFNSFVGAILTDQAVVQGG